MAFRSWTLACLHLCTVEPLDADGAPGGAIMALDLLLPSFFFFHCFATGSWGGCSEQVTARPND
jgi:hypothetical protein